MEQRKELQWFANAMESKLKENDHKGGWRNLNTWYLFGRLKDEVQELKEELERLDNRQEELTEVSESVLSECVDIANFAMMIADNGVALRQPDVMLSLPSDGEIDSFDLSKYPHMTQEGARLIRWGMTVMRDEIRNRVEGNGA